MTVVEVTVTTCLSISSVTTDKIQQELHYVIGLRNVLVCR